MMLKIAFPEEIGDDFTIIVGRKYWCEQPLVEIKFANTNTVAFKNALIEELGKIEEYANSKWQGLRYVEVDEKELFSALAKLVREWWNHIDEIKIDREVILWIS